TFMLGLKTVTRLMGRLVRHTTPPTMCRPHTRRVMRRRGRRTGHRHSMKDIAQCTGRAQPTLPRLSTATLMRKNLRGRLRRCHTTAPRIAHTTKLMAGRHIVSETSTAKGGSVRTVLCLDWDDAFSSVLQAHCRLRVVRELNQLGHHCRRNVASLQAALPVA